MSFVKGDRVKYTGHGSYNTPGLFGKVGTVKSVDTDCSVAGRTVFVAWDDVDSWPNGVYPANLEKVKEVPFKEGDRVRFTGKHSPLFTNNHRVGKTGTVDNISIWKTSPVGVIWENDVKFPVYHFPENLEKTEDKPMNVSNTFTAPTTDPVQVLRDQASTIEEIAVAWQYVADKLRDSADAMENVSALIDAATNNL